MKSDNINNKTNGVIPSSRIKASSSTPRSERKDQVLWACFGKLELPPSSIRNVLLLGYSNGFQVLDVEDATNVREIASKHVDPVSFLQIQPFPQKSEEGCEGFRDSHPLLLVVACDKSNIPGTVQNGIDGYVRDHTDRFGRCIVMGRCSSFSSDSHGAEDKLSGDALISHSKMEIPGST